MAQIGNWKIKGCLGNGGNATVFKVCNDTGEYFALKRLDSKEPEKIDRFKRETSFIEEHPELITQKVVLPIIDKDLECETPYYVMPLAEPLKNRKLNSLGEKCDAIYDILNGIEALHKLQIAHRDIKPENILFYDGKHYLSDFGLIFIEAAIRITKEKDKERIGAKRTIAPEMERSMGYHANPYKADIYSVAKTIWMILTEDYDCFEGQYSPETTIALERYETIGTFDDNIPPSIPYYTPLDKLLTECTDNAPSLRPSIGDVIHRFCKWIEINLDFHQKNNYEWREITDKLFPRNVPYKVVWTKQEDIVDILNFLCKYKSLAYVFLPRGGMHYKGAKKHTEERFIEIDMGYICLFPAKSLTFYSVGNDAEWNYFRLDSYDDIKPIYLNNIPLDATEADEELTELSPSDYAPYEVWESGEEYQGYIPTENMRRVCRYYRGAFVLFNTRSPYNLESSTHNRHSLFSEDEFEFYIKVCARGRFGLKYNEFIFEEVKRLFREESLSNN